MNESDQQPKRATFRSPNALLTTVCGERMSIALIFDPKCVLSMDSPDDLVVADLRKARLPDCTFKKCLRALAADGDPRVLGALDQVDAARSEFLDVALEFLKGRREAKEVYPGQWQASWPAHLEVKASAAVRRLERAIEDVANFD